jgi:hypothetical protein
MCGSFHEVGDEDSGWRFLYIKSSYYSKTVKELLDAVTEFLSHISLS